MTIMQQHHVNQMTLGEMLLALARFDDSATVYFDFCGQAPTRLTSFRGYYDQLALCHEEDAACTVGALRGWLSAAVGATFTGYKGGDYVMARSTRLWVANFGRSGGTAVAGVLDDTGTCIIRTEYVPWVLP